MARCPTCGQPFPITQAVPNIVTADELITAMRERGNDRQTRDVYLSANRGGYYLTYSGAIVAQEAIQEALERGLIALTYPNCTDSWSLPAKSAECHRLYNKRAAKHAAERERP